MITKWDLLIHRKTGCFKQHCNIAVSYINRWRAACLLVLVLCLGGSLAMGVLRVSANLSSIPDVQYRSTSTSEGLPSLPNIIHRPSQQSTRNQPVTTLQTQDSVEDISITDSGFDPATLNIIIGTEVVWTNNTAAAVTLAER